LEALLDELGRRQQQQQQQQEPLQPTSAAPTRLLQLDLKQCSFVGMDIDPTAIAHCREYFSKRCSDNISIQPNITWMTLDFLQSQRSSVMDNLQVDGARNSGTEDSIMVIVLGSPPYSAGAGNGGDGMQRDLPMRFVQHAIQAWRASIVTFLMPERCGQHVKSLSATNLTGDPMQPNVSSNVEGYALANIPLEAPSVFYFQGLATVKQPSIIQCFWRSAHNKTAPMLTSHTSYKA
jgi:hypothetical protein